MSRSKWAKRGRGFLSLGLTAGLIVSFQNCGAPMGSQSTSNSIDQTSTGPTDGEGGISITAPGSTPQTVCSFGNQLLWPGMQTVAYLEPSVPNGETCVSEIRQCSGTGLTGTFEYSSCSVQAPQAATVPAGAISRLAIGTGTAPAGSGKIRNCPEGFVYQKEYFEDGPQKGVQKKLGPYASAGSIAGPTSTHLCVQVYDGSQDEILSDFQLLAHGSTCPSGFTRIGEIYNSQTVFNNLRELGQVACGKFVSKSLAARFVTMLYVQFVSSVNPSKNCDAGDEQAGDLNVYDIGDGRDFFSNKKTPVCLRR